MEPANYIQNRKAFAIVDDDVGEPEEVKQLLARITKHKLTLTETERKAVDMANKQDHSFTAHQVSLFRLIASRRKK